MAPPPKEATRTPRRALVTAIVLIVVIQRLVPFGREILYPFTLLATWVHEMGHGLTALILGGHFARLEIFGDASGLAHTAVSVGWRDAMVAMGGLLAPPIAGAAILGLAQTGRRAQVLLAGLAVALAISVAIWVRSPAGVIAMPIVAVALGWVAWRGSPDRRLLVAQGVGVLLAIDTWTRLDYLFTATAEVDGARRSSDISRVAESLGGHYLVWGLLLALVSLSLCALGIWLAWRKPKSK
jgi:hypothetical protein